jgi:hypothetical protein
MVYCVLLCLSSLVYGICCRAGHFLSSVLLCLGNLFSCVVLFL